MKKIVPLLLIFTFLISILVLPSFAAVITDTTTWQPIEIDKLEYYSGSEYVSVLPSSTSSYLVTSTSNFPLSFQGSTAYSSLFNLPILSYTYMDLYFDLTPSADLDKVYTSASSVYLTFSLAFYCTSTNFVYPDTISVQNATLYTDSVTFSKVEDLSGDKAYASYVGTINLDPTTMSNVAIWQWISHFSMGGQMQGYNVTYAIASTSPVYTFTYEDSQAVEQATFDIISNQISPTVQNISVKADQIIQQQQEISGQLGEIQGSLDTMNNTLESMPEEIGDEVYDALESAADEEYNKALEDGQSNVDELLGAVDLDTDSYLTGLNNLVSGLSYDGTESSWAFPALYIPAVAGVGPFELSSEKNIDFRGVIQEFFPAQVVALIQYLLTGAVFLFLIYEAMDLVLMILGVKSFDSLDGGGKDKS